MNTKIRFNSYRSVKRSEWMLFKLLLLGILIFSTSHKLSSQCLSIEKRLLAVAPASSGIPGNMDVTYQVEIINNCPGISFGINVADVLNAPGNLGTAFVRVVGTPVIALVSATGSGGTINGAFDGTIANPNLTAADGFLMVGDSVIYQFTAEVDVDAKSAPASLKNVATVSSVLPGGSQNTNIVFIPNCWTNCQLACNNQVQVSVNSICEADILADMILEGENGVCADLGFYEVTIYYNNVKVNLPLDETYLNKKLKVNVRNIVCNNNCWGNLILEDKSAPPLICRVRDTIGCGANTSPAVLGFPVPIIYVDQTVYPYVVSGLDACGVVYLTYQDIVQRYDCNNNSLSATLYRKWCAKDLGGYESCCIDTIDFRRGTLADITLPIHYDGLPGNRPYLKCDGNWTKFKNGFPDTTATGTGKPGGVYCGNINYDFTDDTIQVCKGTFKLLRRWIILDWCNPTQRIDFIQQIKVVDDVAPSVVCPDNYSVNTNPWNCLGSLILPVPQNLTPQTIVDSKIPYVVENCSGWTYTVSHVPAINPQNCVPIPGLGDTKNITRLPDGRYRIDNMPLGCNWIYYTITDGCGNSSICQFEIIVVDKTPPVAVCQEHTVVSLGSNGKATAPAAVFDDHSHDNCGNVTFEVRRMTASVCGSTRYGPSVEFCCEDVSATVPVRVILKVSDAAGNTSECMINVFVQDKLAPHVTCPRDTVVNCESNLSNLSIFGNATATDNCTVRMESRVINNLNSCNLGSLIREFIAIDKGGLRDSCRQIINVVDSTPFRAEDIVWPVDVIINGCTESPSPSVSGKPAYLNKNSCNQPISTYDDLTFNYVEGVCFKILRKWTVVDWCTYDASLQRGIWYHTQVIKINNLDVPVITSSCKDQQYCITNNCEVRVNLEATATDICTPQSELRWTSQLDLGNDGIGVAVGNSNRFSFNFGEGTHRITWTVEDQCGNKSSCSYLIVVRDCKLPTPYCLESIITVPMQTSKNVTLWAKDFNLNSEDNCTPKNALKYSFTNNIKDSFKIFSCADIPDGRSQVIEVEIYVTDLAGNKDLCKTKLILQDNQNVCPDVPTFGNISGSIRGYNKNPSSEVLVSIETAGKQKSNQSTNNNGTYVFGNIDMYNSYDVIPTYTENPLEGISTKDIVKIQRHIIGLEYLDSPYKLIAADVNKSGTITARDISELRKMILGVQNTFENNSSWNFVDATYPITESNFASYRNSISIENFSNSVTNIDFISVKTGDVTGEANTGFGNHSQSRSLNNILLGLDQTTFHKGDLIRFPVRNLGEQIMVSGFQMSLNFNMDAFEFMKIESGKLDINSDDYHYLNEGTLRISWNAESQTLVSNSDVLFYITGKVNTSGILDEAICSLDMNSLTPEFYTPSQDFGISLVYRANDPKMENGYELFQNVPNPFFKETVIYFNIPKESEINIGLYDMSGKKLRNYQMNAKKGLNSVKVKTDDLNMNGVLYYRLETEEFSSTKKMIILK